ncbi:uncharacterized protein LOC106160894 [Lingula anatina]|uniref:Uncharacterized protein LOC106160894 n=1 Tax=Lingula anatina TaxID=7574 RepID=A0A1S3I6X7_LINAN|nr:uncharacterized protein LOC106160894 [Lingula anatina]|eukprot:XP_013393119.1 uncharacterized protein LOC106160894 [Lingula anatina]
MAEEQKETSQNETSSEVLKGPVTQASKSGTKEVSFPACGVTGKWDKSPHEEQGSKNLQVEKRTLHEETTTPCPSKAMVSVGSNPSQIRQESCVEQQFFDDRTTGQPRDRVDFDGKFLSLNKTSPNGGTDDSQALCLKSKRRAMDTLNVQKDSRCIQPSENSGEKSSESEIQEITNLEKNISVSSASGLVISVQTNPRKKVLSGVIPDDSISIVKESKNNIESTKDRIDQALDDDHDSDYDPDSPCHGSERKGNEGQFINETRVIHNDVSSKQNKIAVLEKGTQTEATREASSNKETQTIKEAMASGLDERKEAPNRSKPSKIPRPVKKSFIETQKKPAMICIVGSRSSQSGLCHEENECDVEQPICEVQDRDAGRNLADGEKGIPSGKAKAQKESEKCLDISQAEFQKGINLGLESAFQVKTATSRTAAFKTKASITPAPVKKQLKSQGVIKSACKPSGKRGGSQAAKIVHDTPRPKPRVSEKVSDASDGKAQLRANTSPPIMHRKSNAMSGKNSPHHRVGPTPSTPHGDKKSEEARQHQGVTARSKKGYHDSVQRKGFIPRNKEKVVTGDKRGDFPPKGFREMQKKHAKLSKVRSTSSQPHLGHEGNETQVHETHDVKLRTITSVHKKESSATQNSDTKTTVIPPRKQISLAKDQLQQKVSFGGIRWRKSASSEPLDRGKNKSCRQAKSKSSGPMKTEKAPGRNNSVAAISRAEVIEDITWHDSAASEPPDRGKKKSSTKAKSSSSTARTTEATPEENIFTSNSGEVIKDNIQGRRQRAEICDSQTVPTAFHHQVERNNEEEEEDKENSQTQPKTFGDLVPQTEGSHFIPNIPKQPPFAEMDNSFLPVEHSISDNNVTESDDELDLEELQQLLYGDTCRVSQPVEGVGSDFDADTQGKSTRSGGGEINRNLALGTSSRLNQATRGKHGAKNVAEV